MSGEIRLAGSSLRAGLQPLELVRRHPRSAGILGGLAVLLALRFLRRSGGSGGAKPETEPRSLAHTFGRSLLSTTAKTAGRALPGILLWGLARRGRGRGGRGGSK